MIAYRGKILNREGLNRPFAGNHRPRGFGNYQDVKKERLLSGIIGVHLDSFVKINLASSGNLPIAGNPGLYRKHLFDQFFGLGISLLLFGKLIWVISSGSHYTHVSLYNINKLGISSLEYL